MHSLFDYSSLFSRSKSNSEKAIIPSPSWWIKLMLTPGQFINQNVTFARLISTQPQRMKLFTKTIALIATLFLGYTPLCAQDYTTPDTTAAADPFGTNAPFEEYNQSTEPASPPKAPYVRFVVPVDTLTELVTYTEVVEEEEAGTDSLYWRAKRWMKNEFKGNKKQTVKKDDKKDFKIVMEGEFPLYIYTNKYSKYQNGKVVFDMEIRFKEGRYKYKINNLVHVVDPPPGQEKETRTYFEFYQKSEINPRGNDAILMAADTTVNKMIKGLKKYCKEPVFVDDDDW